MPLSYSITIYYNGAQWSHDALQCELCATIYRAEVTMELSVFPDESWPNTSTSGLFAFAFSFELWTQFRSSASHNSLPKLFFLRWRLNTNNLLLWYVSTSLCYSSTNIPIYISRCVSTMTQTLRTVYQLWISCMDLRPQRHFDTDSMHSDDNSN